MINLFKLFVASTSRSIPEYQSNRIFGCHPTRIFESFQGTIYKPTFTLIKTNAQTKIWKNSCTQLLGNVLFEYFDKFQAYKSSVSEKVESQFFLRKEILHIKWVSFYSLFYDQSYLSVITIHFQFFSFKFNVLGTRNSLKKKRLVELV